MEIVADIVGFLASICVLVLSALIVLRKIKPGRRGDDFTSRTSLAPDTVPETPHAKRRRSS